VQADSSTARKYGGTGLGLTISAQLVELMGGRMGADSEPDHGSTFWFDVPLEIAQAPEVVDIRPVLLDTGERNADGSLSESAPRVLVAEDNTVNQMLAVRLLDKCGFRADVVSNGVEALEAITRDDYVAVLMDCQMPEMDGYDASRAIRDRENGGAHMPIIAATAHSMSGDREKCLAAGMDEYVTKPIRAHDLSEAIARAIAAGADGNGSKRRSVTRTRRRRTRAPT
jgi:CheY-like chemotaxis protein